VAGRATLRGRVSLFCRHNRYTAECPICSKGTVLDRDARPARRPRPSAARSGGTRPRRAQAGAAVVKGPYASAGPYADDDGESYEVRLERVPGGLRLAEWAAGGLRRRAPVLGAAADLGALVLEAAERSGLREREAAALRGAAAPEAAAEGRSPGRSGELRDELRVEPLPDGRIRVARWVLRPNSGWELQEAPVMLPAARYAEALAAASSGAPGTMRP
jgi:hypothetical protein